MDIRHEIQLVYFWDTGIGSDISSGLSAHLARPDMALVVIPVKCGLFLPAKALYAHERRHASRFLNNNIRMAGGTSLYRDQSGKYRRSQLGTYRPTRCKSLSRIRYKVQHALLPPRGGLHISLYH